MFKQNTYWLRKAVGIGGKGKAPTLTRAKREKRIEHLQKIALSMRMGAVFREQFKAIVEQKKTWRVTRGKGFGVDKKKKSFDKWFSKHIHYPNCIYVFWSEKRCRYVGRTIHGRGRPQQHFGKFWFGGTTRIDVYSVRRASLVPKMECLAIHRWNPAYNKNKAATRKWTKKCPICEMFKQIRTEVSWAFPVRYKKRKRE